MLTQLNRRDFLRISATLAVGASVAAHGSLTAKERTRAIGANDRIRIGLIGCGDRGINVHMASIHKHAQAENLAIVAVCDPWSKARENAAAKAKQWLGADVKQCRTYKDVLELPEVDAVMIASCDHWHSAHLEAAAQAGRHVYVEKPMAIELDDLNRAYDAA